MKIKIILYNHYIKFKEFILNQLWIFKTYIFYPRKDTLVISYYADYKPERPYYKAAIKLGNKLKRWRIPHQIEEVFDQGGYRKNTLFKPSFIYNKLLNTKLNIIWIDCDTNPPSPKLIYSFAKTKKPFVAISSSLTLDEMQGGLLKFSYCGVGIKIVNSWYLHCKYASDNDIDDLDHDALKHAILPRFLDNNILTFLKAKNKQVGFGFSSNLDNNVVLEQKKTSNLDYQLRYQLIDMIDTIHIELFTMNDLENLLKRIKGMEITTGIIIDYCDNSLLGSPEYKELEIILNLKTVKLLY